MSFRLPLGLLNHSLRSTPLLLGAATGTTLYLAPQLFQPRRPLLLDTSPSTISSKDWSTNSHPRPQQRPNIRTIRQLTAGSIFGLISGLAVSLFSKPLALLLGLLVVGVQTAEAYGIKLVPYKTLQGYVKSVDVRGLVRENVAFKVSFGVMFALAALAELPE